MPNRMIDSDYWGRGSIQPLSWGAKSFYLYLITNEHVKPSGVYYITPSTISFDTSIPLEDIDGLFGELETKVKWYADLSLVWVKNFVFRQGKSPRFIQAASKDLTELNLNGVAQEVVAYNLEKYNLSIPYPYRTYGVAMSTKEITKPTKDAELNADQNKELAVVFQAYEENIGILTPMIAERLKDIAVTYPVGWFQMGVAEAVSYNKRNLRYIERILENWQVNGVKVGIRPAEEKKKTKATT